MTKANPTEDKLLVGNCLETLKTLDDASIDSIVTDPPYELGFMGKSWDASGIAYQVELWQQCLRVLKPGGHLLAFGGTRTYHRMAVAIEDAGFEIRDSIHWTYGSGFPKSLNISKAIDKAAKAERTEGRREWSGGKRSGGIKGKNLGTQTVTKYDTPATEAAKKWDGWGTALKPSHEPIVVARKPLIGTVAETVLQHGTGGININATRIGTNGGTKKGQQGERRNNDISDFTTGGEVLPLNSGRFPANTLLTHNHDCDTTCTPNCPIELLDQQSGVSKSPSGLVTQGGKDGGGFDVGSGDGTRNTKFQGHGDSGGASRFFHNSQWTVADDLTPFIYQAKPGKKERNAGLDGLAPVTTRQGMGGTMPIDDDGKERDRFSVTQRNFHPTVKPVELIRYLIRMVTPPKGTVLDPFLGSGTTAVAAVLEGFEWKGCELTEDYLPIINGRVSWATKEAKKKAKEVQLELPQ